MGYSNKNAFLFRKAIFWSILGLIIFSGLAIRLYDLNDLPLDYHPTRQIRALLIARGMYYQNLETAPDWQREMAVTRWKAEGLIEPPILEKMMAVTYQLLGKEVPWVGRLYTIIFWMLGGVGIYLLVHQLTENLVGGLAAMGFFLLLPYGVYASRSLLPDILMVTLLVWFWWAALRWRLAPDWLWAAIAGTLAGAAMLVKFVAGIYILPTLITILFLIQSPKIKIPVHSLWGQRILMLFIAGLLPLSYLVFGVYLDGSMQSQFGLRFFPNLWLQLSFYMGWFNQIDRIIGLVLITTAFAGIFLYKKYSVRLFIVSLWIGYFLCGFVFPYHYSTHDYYHLPIIPLVAISIAPVAVVLVDAFLNANPRRMVRAAMLILCISGVVVNLWQIRSHLKKADYRPEAQYWQNIAEVIHNRSVVTLTPDYGYRLEYWGWVYSVAWPETGDLSLRQLAGQNTDEFNQLFQDTVSGKQLFLVTLLEQFDQQPGLKNKLTHDYPILQKADDYLLFDLEHPRK